MVLNNSEVTGSLCSEQTNEWTESISEREINGADGGKVTSLLDNNDNDYGPDDGLCV